MGKIVKKHERMQTANDNVAVVAVAVDDVECCRNTRSEVGLLW